MNSDTIKRAIEDNLRRFNQQPLRAAATALLNTLGYHSQRVGNAGIDSDRFERLKADAAETANPSQKLRIEEWAVFHYVLQVTDTEINEQATTQQSLFESTAIDNMLMRSYMFVTLQLAGGTYTRTQLADITRFINKAFRQPIMVIFRYGSVLTLAIINRRAHKRDSSKQVLEKVTLIKDINLDAPKRAHLDILSELELHRLIETEGVHNFDSLHKAWDRILNTDALNRRFYRELEKWYEWAKAEGRFPDENRSAVDKEPSSLYTTKEVLYQSDMQVIRMITRLLFVWFLKEKGLVPANLFEAHFIFDEVLFRFDPETSDYYQSVLQNLFFATLNTPIKARAFSRRNHPDHRNPSKYRYADLLRDPAAFLESLKLVPFVNGGLFDCLDTFEATGDGGVRIDCFSDNERVRQKLHVPTKLFFDEENGLFPLFSRYKFTVEENTPIEQEVALDPELLGQVFENLLGAYNPETQSTARKATGAYYTPRQIVDYMVDEALIAYFLQKVPPCDGDTAFLEERLRDDLLVYELEGDIDKPDTHLIYEGEIAPMIQAIDELKIIDPAVGSGAFPMGLLNKLVLILQKVDPQNERWKNRQLVQAEKISDPESRAHAIAAIEAVFSEANRYNDYGRKLYLIQNSIYGVDIQPIAITIAKLRFFISLIIEQVPNENPNDNYGIHPLPNLETKFVSANTLIGLEHLQVSDFQQLLLESDMIQDLRQEIAVLRAKYFRANTRRAKQDYMKQEKACRNRLTDALATEHAAWCRQEDNRISEQVAQVPQEPARQQLLEKLQKSYRVRKAKLAAGVAAAKRIAYWDAYDQNAVADFFDAEWMFGVKDGFDIVIGNPPYIERKKISSSDKQALQTYFGDFFTRTADISVYFYKRAAELLRDSGILTYICTNKFMRSGYGKNLRQFLTSEMSLQALLDFGGISVFEAAVDTCIILSKKSCASAENTFRTAVLRADSEEFNVREAFEKQKFSMKISQLTSEEWTLERRETLVLLEKLQNTGTPLGKSHLHLGINTGCIAAYIIDSATRTRLIVEDAKSERIIKPLLKGRNLRKWKVEWANMYLILIESSTNRTWPWSDAKNDAEAEQIFSLTYPVLHRHLKSYQKQLSARTSPGKFYWELRSCAYYDAFTGPKIIYADISTSMRAYYDTNGFFADSTVYCLPTTDLSLLAILNSTLFDWYARYKFTTLNDTWAGGSFRCNKANMMHFPIADRTPAQKVELSQLVEQILADPESNGVPALEKKIDALVYRLYRLSAAEIALIEQTYRDAGMAV